MTFVGDHIVLMKQQSQEKSELYLSSKARQLNLSQDAVRAGSWATPLLPRESPQV